MGRKPKQRVSRSRAAKSEKDEPDDAMPNLRDVPQKCRDCDNQATKYGPGGNGPFCHACYSKWAKSIEFLILPPKW